MNVEVLVSAGLGLDYDTIWLDRTSDVWLTAGSQLRGAVAETLGRRVTAVEVVGSSSVLGLLAKPIVDLAVGLSEDQQLDPVTELLESGGWIYRGDAGDDGGHVFVLEARPWYRVAHLHVVDQAARQWRDYLRFRDLLRADAGARLRYETVKLRLMSEFAGDRAAYATGKTEVVASLLDSAS